MSPEFRTRGITLAVAPSTGVRSMPAAQARQINAEIGIGNMVVEHLMHVPAVIEEALLAVALELQRVAAKLGHIEGEKTDAHVM